jgi:hypothetical protein
MCEKSEYVDMSPGPGMGSGRHVEGRNTKWHVQDTSLDDSCPYMAFD